MIREASPNFYNGLGLPAGEIVLRDVLTDGLVCTPKAYVTHHMLMFRIDRFRRAIISKNLQNLLNAITSAQDIAALTQTNLTWGRLHVQNRYRRTCRCLHPSSSHPCVDLAFVGQEACPATIEGWNFLAAARDRASAKVPYLAPTPPLNSNLPALDRKTGRY